MLDQPTQLFVEQVAGLTSDALATAFDRMVALRRAGGKEASRATRPSAPENSELEHLVRTTLLPRADELNAARPGLHSDAKSAVVIAARAVLKRRQLSDAQFDVLVLPFIEAGVEVPQARPALADATAPSRDRLEQVGRDLFAKLAQSPTLNVIDLPDGLGVCVVHVARGGGKLYVAPDESVLFVGSAVDYDAGLGAFRDGARTPREKFDLTSPASAT